MKRITLFLSVFLVVGMTVAAIVSAVNSAFIETKLVASDGARGDRFSGYYGSGVSVSGNFAIIGSPLADPNMTSSGAAYIFHYNGTDWVEYQKLTSSDDWSPGCFGSSVSISGDTAIIGAVLGPAKDYIQTGAAYIFHYDGTNWVEQHKLLASDGAQFDGFGRSVSLSGDTAIVGAYTSGPAGYVALSGAAYVFRYDGTNWVEQQKLTASDGSTYDYDDFGKTVSISGDYAIVGTRLDDDNGISSGAAYIFHYDGTGWVEQQKLLASNAVPGDMFGNSVSISGNYAVVGAYASDDGLALNTGSAYIFYNDGTQWVEQQELFRSDARAYGYFGGAVSIAGDLVLVGAEQQNVAYQYLFDGNDWIEGEELRASDASTLGKKFGNAVSISADNTMLVGANGDGYNGAAYIYTSSSKDSDRYAKREKGKKCYDGLDNDRDGLTDGADPDCGGEGKGKTCSDGLDNDMDGLFDCSDPDCSTNKTCEGIQATLEDKPDLIVTDIIQDGPYYLRVKYMNVGAAGDGDFLIKTKAKGKSFNGNPYYRFPVPTPGEELETGGLTIGLIGLSSGSIANVTAEIDWENRVDEQDESNNFLTKRIVIE